MNLVGILLILVNHGNALDNGLALTPPKGWLSWQYIRCDTNCTENPDGCLSETVIKKTADYMVSTGLKHAGYDYVTIDDCWMEKTRDQDGNLVANKERFPSGIKALADYIHKKGLKFGIYADMGTLTCANYPGSLLYMQQDANIFAKWGVDYLKMDGCYGSQKYYDLGYPTMSSFLNKTGRRILFACSWPGYESNPNYNNVAKYCNIWRNAHDIEDSWESMSSIIDIYGKNKGNFLQVSAPGQFNDPDMLLIGTFGLSNDAYRTQLIMWAMLAAPLMISTDVSLLDKDAIELLTNPYILDLSNDPLGKSAVLYEKHGSTSVWIRELKFNKFAFAFVSFATGGNYYHYTTKLNVPIKRNYRVVELTTNKEIGHIKSGDSFTVKLHPYGTYAIVLWPELMVESLEIDISINL